MYLATLSLFIYIFTKISADLYAGSLFLTLSIPELNIYLAVIILLAITVVYAIAGGLKVFGCSIYDWKSQFRTNPSYETSRQISKISFWHPKIGSYLRRSVTNSCNGHWCNDSCCYSLY